MQNKLKILWLESDDYNSVTRGKEAGAKMGIQVDSLDAYDLSFSADGKVFGAFAEARDLADYYDAVIIRSFMPQVAEALILARLFKEAGKVVVDEGLTAEGFAMSKMHDYIFLARNGVDIPRTKQFPDHNKAAAFAAELGYPCVIKGIHGSEGRHVHRVHSEAQLRKKLMQYKSGEVMVQEYLNAEVDYRVITIGYKALPVYVSRKPRANDFRTNFELNEQVISHPISEAPELQDIAERAARVLRREFSGVDIRCRGDKPLVLEANRKPGYKGFEEATGFDVAGAFIEYVVRKCENSLEMVA